MTAGYEIGLAEEGDIDGILDLQERNLPQSGGMLSARLPRAWFEAALSAIPVVDWYRLFLNRHSLYHSSRSYLVVEGSRDKRRAADRTS